MRKILFVALISMFSSFALASNDYGISAQETYERVQNQSKEQPVLFIDVRDPVEIMFVGSTDVVDTNIPFLLVDRTQWDEDRGIFRLYPNKDFADQVKAELKKRNLPESTQIITMCRSGSERGKPSAEVLRKAGLENSYYVVNGFQGDAIKEGDQAGFRLKNGWQNSNLPWSRMGSEKVYKNFN